jgi:hypothetical protein
MKYQYARDRKAHLQFKGREVCDQVQEWVKSLEREPYTIAGYVYLFRRTGTDEYKIGISNDPQRRVLEARTNSKDRLQIVHVIATDDPEDIEGLLHRRFKVNRIRGEWFWLDDIDVRSIQRIGDGNSANVGCDMVAAFFRWDYVEEANHG